MRLYTIYERAGSSPVLIPEAFSWPAALFAPVWALWRGGWWTAVILLAVTLGFALVRFSGMGPEAGIGLIILQVVAVGLLGPDLLRWDFSRRGYRLVAVVAAVHRDAALLRYLAMDRSSPVLDHDE